MPKAKPGKKLSQRKSTRRSVRDAGSQPSPVDLATDVDQVFSSTQSPAAGSSASTSNGEFGTMGGSWPLVTSPQDPVIPQIQSQAPPSIPPAPVAEGLNSHDNFTPALNPPFPTQPDMLSCVCDELGGEVPSSVKEKIWKGEFVELGGLLKRESLSEEGSQLQAFSLCASGSALMLRPQSKAPVIASIEQWTSAFLIYASIYLERHCMRARELLKYIDIVRSIVRFGGFNFSSFGGNQPFRPYDRSFRRGNFPFSGYANRQGANRAHGAAPAPSRSSPVCFAFNAGSCQRIACRYAHRCGKCSSAAHGSHACNSAAAVAKQKPSSNSN
ncbi:uncharacterized protein LOC121408919 isoform X2 [Lytechinus variegatus]|uniref:uncharacterized protein LOC121408919 isoform X2 n=1 Tax=Lytechinus variegatus TaxID=7654 RepID=UPI001BB19255|nr:uncharacterized protein LOC121408919 isoform X2 [Lytechinus variegatus]